MCLVYIAVFRFAVALSYSLSRYLTNFTIDTIFGVLLLWQLQGLLVKLAVKYDWSYLKTPGGYGLESPECYKYDVLFVSIFCSLIIFRTEFGLLKPYLGGACLL